MLRFIRKKISILDKMSLALSDLSCTKTFGDDGEIFQKISLCSSSKESSSCYVPYFNLLKSMYFDDFLLVTNISKLGISLSVSFTCLSSFVVIRGLMDV